jgi:hypothetical protein
MNKLFCIALSAVALSSVVGCGSDFVVRLSDKYRDDTQAALDSKAADIKACYDAALASNKGAAGFVVVNFTVEHETGVVDNVVIDTAKSTAPDPVKACVQTALQGLRLAPPDKLDGHARNFTWQFTPPS